MRRIICVVALLALFLQTTACGTLLYPERKGQTGGSIDPGVAVLDAAGLLLFVVPGLVAFGVDFINGTIYLPNTQKSSDSDAMIREVTVAAEKMDARQIEGIVAAATGYEVTLADQNTRVIEVTTPAELLEGLHREM